MKKGFGMLECWMVGLLGFLLRFGRVRFADDGGGGDPGDGGGDPGGGDPWFSGVEGLPEGAADTLGSYESQAAALSALHERSRPLAERVVAADPELADHQEKLKEFDSTSKLAKSYIELQKKLGSNPLVPPGENATEEEKATFNQQLNTLRGVPESSEKYEYELPDEVMSQIDKEQLGGRLNELHKAGFSNDQVQAALNMFVEEAGFVSEKASEVQKGWKSESAAWMKEQWGEQAEANHELARRAMQKMGVLDDLESTGFSTKKGVIDSYYQLAQAMGEGELPDAGKAAGNTLKDQLDALYADPAYTNPRLRVGDKTDIMKKVLDLQAKISQQKKG